MARRQTDLQGYLEKKVPASYYKRIPEVGVIEDFEAHDPLKGRVPKLRDVRRAIRTYFTQELGLTQQGIKGVDFRFVGASEEAYGINLSFISRSAPVHFQQG